MHRGVEVKLLIRRMLSLLLNGWALHDLDNAHRDVLFVILQVAGISDTQQPPRYAFFQALYATCCCFGQIVEPLGFLGLMAETIGATEVIVSNFSKAGALGMEMVVQRLCLHIREVLILISNVHDIRVVLRIGMGQTLILSKASRCLEMDLIGGFEPIRTVQGRCHYEAFGLLLIE